MENNSNNQFPKLKPKGTISIPTSKDSEVKNKIQINPTQTLKEPVQKNDFLSKLKFFEQKAQDNKKPNNKLNTSKTILENKDKIKDNKEMIEKNNKINIIKENKKEENNIEKTESKNKDEMKNELKVKLESKMKEKNKDISKNINIIKKAQTILEDNKEKEKEKILKTFEKRQTYQFSQLERPLNYSDIEKYWGYEKNLLDYKILDITSK